MCLSSSDTAHSEPIAQTPKLAKREIDSDRTAEARRMQDAEAEYNAVTCVALYVLLMSFSQKGIDKLRVHHEGLEMRDPGRKRFFVTEGFDHGTLILLVVWQVVVLQLFFFCATSSFDMVQGTFLEVQ